MLLSCELLTFYSSHELQSTTEKSSASPVYEMVPAFSVHNPTVEPNIAYGNVEFQHKKSELRRVIYIIHDFVSLPL